MGTTFVISPVAGLLTDLIGIRTTTFLGGVLACAGMLLSSMFAYNVFALYFTYGIMYGLGCALAYTPSLVILGHYFKKYLGVVNGIVTAGSSIFTIILSYLIAWCLGSVGLVWALRVLALIACGIILCALLFKPVMQKRKKRVKVTDVFNVSIWRNTKYLVWALVIPISLFGYFVPYVHMSKFVNDDFGHNSDGKLPVICMGITSGLGRLFFGYIADLPKVNRILLQQISFLSIGILTILLPSTKGNFPLLIGLSLAMGFFDGCFISLLGPIAFDICGPSGATQAIGFLFGLCSLPMTLGPFVAGKLYDRSNNYDLAFRLAGIPPIVGALSMFLMKFVDEPEIEKESSRQPLRTLSKEDSGLHRSTTAPPLASAGRLLRKNSMSTYVWGSDEDRKERCYSYSIL